LGVYTDFPSAGTVGVLTGHWMGDPGFKSWHRLQFLFSKRPDQLWGPKQPLTEWVLGFIAGRKVARAWGWSMTFTSCQG